MFEVSMKLKYLCMTHIVTEYTEHKHATQSRILIYVHIQQLKIHRMFILNNIPMEIILEISCVLEFCSSS